MSSKYVPLLLLLSGCVVTDVGNPADSEGTKETPIQMRAYDSSLPNALVLATGIEVTHAWISVDELQARPCGDDLADVQIEEPFIVDLISGQTYPAPVKLHSDKAFCELSMEFKPLDQANAGVPSDMVGLSVMVRARNADGTPIEVRADFNETLKLKGEVTLRELDSLLVGFAADEWLGPEVSELEPQMGRILIAAGVNDDSYDIFRDAFKESSRLFRDEDRDGEIDTGEDQDALAKYAAE